MITFKFDRHKYNHPLAMDFFKIEDNEELFISEEAHDTDFFEIMMFSDIDGYILLDDNKIELKERTFLFISPFQKRRWFIKENKAKGWALIFEKDFLGNFFSDDLFVYKLQYFYNYNLKTAFIPEPDLFPFNNSMFNEILEEIKNFKPDSDHILRALLYYVLVKLNRGFVAFHKLENQSLSNNYGLLFKEALEKNYKQLHQVNDYVSVLNVSRITLNQSVKKQFNITASNMIKDRLISEVKSQLIHTNKTISEIAFHLNFSEPNNLIRLFKLKTEMSPNQYRLSKR